MKAHVGKGLLVLLLASVSIIAFISFRKPDTPKADKSQFIDPEDMVQGEVYYFADHGNGMEIQFDHMDKGLIYTTIAVVPSLSSFTRNASLTVYDAGTIRLLTAAELAHLQRCVSADKYVP
jgi:hypothetical protein